MRLYSIAALAGVAALAAGGFVLKGQMRCTALEDDYLNSVSAARQALLLTELAPESQAMANVSAGLAEGEIELAEELLPAIYAECGESAGRTAFRKGSAIVLGR